MDRRLAIAIGVSPAKKKQRSFYTDRAPETPSPPPPAPPPPLTAGLSQANIEAVLAMHDKLKELPVPESDRLLLNAQQQPLMQIH